MLITTRSLDYYGTVSGIYGELEIRKVIGEVLSNLVQHCLGFTKSHLYTYFQYLESLPIERLSGL